MSKKCPFCPLERKTEWYKVYPDGAIICRDLNDRGYKLRVLGVFNGKKWHHPKCWYSKELQDKLKKRAMKVAHELIKEGKANRVVFAMR